MSLNEDIHEDQINEIMRVENLNFTYENGYKVFENINLSINEIKFVSVIGRSGIGKSTFLRLLGGFLKPDSGNKFIFINW